MRVLGQPAVQERRAVDLDDLIRASHRALARQDRDAFVATLREIVAKGSAASADWMALAQDALTLGEASLAITMARFQAETHHDDVDSQLFLAEVLAWFNRIGEALSEAGAAAKRFPDDSRLHEFIGLELLRLGDAEGADDALRRARALNSRTAWTLVAKLHPFSKDDPEIAALKNALESDNGGAAVVRAGMLYALGEMLDAARQPAEAFAAFSEGARLIRRERPYRREDAGELLSEVQRDFTKQFLRELSPSSVESNRPIFVRGLPRSGTTLVEQILASHSQVRDGGEHFLLRRSVMGVGEFTPSEMRGYAARQAGGDVWTKVGHTYLRLLDDWFGPEGRVVDKSLALFNVGAALHIFPNARMIWLKRDPAANAWSCFKTRFASAYTWSWSFEDIADFFKVHDALYAHWSALFPERILTVHYEDLVHDSDVWIPRMLAHVGLEDEPQTRRFHEARRSVRTASVAQVRRPLSTAPNQEWRRYEPYMQPFFDAYGVRR
jgi:tetratricopeptide (TPR) repeat protein